jgi:hypothetical protein
VKVVREDFEGGFYVCLLWESAINFGCVVERKRPQNVGGKRIVVASIDEHQACLRLTRSWMRLSAIPFWW